MSVLGRRKHFDLIKSSHATEEMANDIIKELEQRAESVDSLISRDNGEFGLMALPMEWLKA